MSNLAKLARRGELAFIPDGMELPPSVLAQSLTDAQLRPLGSEYNAALAKARPYTTVKFEKAVRNNTGRVAGNPELLFGLDQVTAEASVVFAASKDELYLLDTLSTEHNRFDVNLCEPEGPQGIMPALEMNKVVVLTDLPGRGYDPREAGDRLLALLKDEHTAEDLQSGVVVIGNDGETRYTRATSKSKTADKASGVTVGVAVKHMGYSKKYDKDVSKYVHLDPSKSGFREEWALYYNSVKIQEAEFCWQMAKENGFKHICMIMEWLIPVAFRMAAGAAWTTGTDTVDMSRGAHIDHGNALLTAIIAHLRCCCKDGTWRAKGGEHVLGSANRVSALVVPTRPDGQLFLGPYDSLLHINGATVQEDLRTGKNGAVEAGAGSDLPFPGFRRSNSYYIQRKVIAQLLRKGHYDSNSKAKAIACYLLGH
jgi:hypothetical protein